jgi:hypothetical protein
VFPGRLTVAAQCANRSPQSASFDYAQGRLRPTKQTLAAAKLIRNSLNIDPDIVDPDIRARKLCNPETLKPETLEISETLKHLNPALSSMRRRVVDDVRRSCYYQTVPRV